MKCRRAIPVALQHNSQMCAWRNGHTESTENTIDRDQNTVAFKKIANASLEYSDLMKKTNGIGVLGQGQRSNDDAGKSCLFDPI
ncbi:unnamed protein product [Soboliphyme baturini]|uniref:Transposase n=1 Tax=Soboliphyme baturini TaxID=241478 RepID=A0A183IT28_9BILA|nr:unnamed protein product [Soboliphyme baturini]